MKPIAERTTKISIIKEYRRKASKQWKNILVSTEAHGVSVKQCQGEFRLDKKNIFFRYHLGIRETHNQCELSWQQFDLLSFFLKKHIRFLYI